MDGRYTWGTRSRVRTSRRRLLAGAAAGGAAVALAACGGGSKEGGGGSSGAASTTGGAPAASADQQPVRGGTLTFAIAGDPPNFDMQANSTYMVNHLMAPVYNQLIQFDPAKGDEAPDTIIGDLASSWEQAGDGLTYTFKLNQGVAYHDGKPFSSADVKASLGRMMDPPKNVVSPRRDSLKVISAVETPDPATVVLKLSRPAPSLLPILAQGWMSIYAEKDIGDGFDFKLKTNGTGPFRLKEYLRGNRITYEANQSYFVKGQPYLGALTCFIIRDPSALVAAFQTGELLYTGLFSPSDVKSLEGSMKNRIVVQRKEGFGFSTINFGAGAPWRDERVRRAVSMSMDRESHIALVDEGEAKVGGYHSPSGIWALSEEELRAIPGYARVTDKVIADAKQLLAAAGVREGHDTTILTRQGQGNEKLSLSIKDSLAKVGIKANLQVLEDGPAYDALNARSFDLAPWGHAIALDDPDAIFAEFYIKDAPRNYSELSSPEVDDLFLKQSQTLDQKQRVALVKELQKKALPLFGKVILSWSLRRWVYSARVKNLTPHVGLYNNNRHAVTWVERT